MFKRPYNPSLVGLAIVGLCILAFSFAIGAGAIAFGRQGQAITLINVPDDYATIQAAIDAADPGDIIQVRGGTYNENLKLNKAVTLTAESFDQINPVNNTTVIDGMGGASAIFIPAGLTQMPAIRGFVIHNSADGIQAFSVFIAEFNYFHSSNHLINYQAGSGGINRNNVYFNAGDDAIHIDDPGRPLVIENNRIMYARDDGIEISLQNTSLPPSMVEVDILNNMIIGSGEDGIQFIDYANDPQDINRRFVIAGNLIANSAKAGIGFMPNGNTVEDYSGADTVEAIRAFNNTLYGNNHGISGGDNLVVFNSIIANSIGRGIWRVQGAPGANAVVAYTLLYNNGLDADQSSLGVGIIAGLDPLFQAEPNPGPDGAWETVDDDFSGLLLQAGSPAIDKGVTQYLAPNGEPVPANPITGFTGASPDLGWREFGSPAFITPTPTGPPTLTPVESPTPLPTETFTPVPTLTSTPVTPALPTGTPILIATPTPQLNIQQIVPASAQANTTVNLVIIGHGFADGDVVTFEGGQGTAPEVAAVDVINPMMMLATINVRLDASFGTQVWDLRVTKPDASTAVLVDAFTVTP